MPLGRVPGGGVQVCFTPGDRVKHLKCNLGMIPFFFVQLFPPASGLPSQLHLMTL